MIIIEDFTDNPIRIRPIKTIPIQIIDIEDLLKSSANFVIKSDFSFRNVDNANITK